MVAHAWSEEKEQYLKYNLKREYVKQQQEAAFTYLMHRFNYIEEKIGESETAKEVLNNIAKERHATLMVVGQHGRKGAKADPTIMGTAVQYLSVRSAAPVLIIKDPITREQRPDGFVMAVCIDGSKKSLAALDLICAMKHPNDRVKVIIAEQENIDTFKVKQTVSDALEEKNCLDKSTIDVLKSEFGKRAKDLIREHVMGNSVEYIDFICVGNQGADFSGDKNHYLGSVANEILRHTKINTIFISQ